MKKAVSIIISYVLFILLLCGCSKSQSQIILDSKDDFSNYEDYNSSSDSSQNESDESFKNHVSVNVITTGEGIVIGDGKYKSGDKVELRAISKNGYGFTHWCNLNGEILSKNAKYFIVAENDITVIAVFKKETVAVDLIVKGRGTVKGAGEYLLNDIIEISANPCEHSTFIGWEFENGEQYSKASKMNLIAKSNVRLIAVFEDAYKECEDYIPFKKKTSTHEVLRQSQESNTYYIKPLTPHIKQSLYDLLNGNKKNNSNFPIKVKKTTTTTIYKSAKIEEGIIFEFGSWQGAEGDFQVQISELKQEAVTKCFTAAIKVGVEKGGFSAEISDGTSTETFISHTKSLVTVKSFSLCDYDPKYLYKVVLIGDYEVITKEVCVEDDFRNCSTMNYEHNILISDFNKLRLALVRKNRGV